MMARAWPELVDDPGGERHIVQLYREPAFMARVSGQWAARALLRGGACVFVCTLENASRLRQRLPELGVDVPASQREGRLVFLDAEELMARFMVGGEPRADLFKPIARDVLSKLKRAVAPGAEVRAFGEMVNILWHRGEKDAAQKLEAIWNEVINEHDVRLLCAYRVDNLAEETHSRHLRGICAGHSQLIPEEHPEAFDSAVSHALVDIFGEEEAGVVRAIFARKRLVPTGMPTSEAVLFALQDAQPEVGRRVIRAARRRYAESVGGG